MPTDLLTDLETDIPDELLQRAVERGYLLESELEDIDTSPRDEIRRQLDELSVVVVDDTTDDTDDDLAPEATVTADPVRDYLNRAGQHELLSRAQEGDLAKRYLAGRAAERQLEEREDLIGRQRATLRRIIDDGRRAQDRLVTANLRLVMPTASKYAGDDMPLIEAIQEGNLGLIRAVEKFDHTKGYKFSTYAVWWIRQAIQRGLARGGRTIRVPTSVWEDAGKIRRAEARLRTDLERDPSIDEISEEVGLNPDRIATVRDAMRPLTSLDMPIGEDGDASLGSILPDEEAVDPEADSAAEDLRTRLEATLDTLPGRERRVIELRYGLDDHPPRTLKAIGEEVGLTRERVRQLERGALARLRDPATAEGLAGAADLLAAA